VASAKRVIKRDSHAAARWARRPRCPRTEERALKSCLDDICCCGAALVWRISAGGGTAAAGSAKDGGFSWAAAQRRHGIWQLGGRLVYRISKLSNLAAKLAHSHAGVERFYALMRGGSV